MPSLDDPLDLYVKIGKVAANWAALEILMDSAIWRFAKVSDELGACITSQLIGPAKRLDALIAIARHRGVGASTISRLKKFAGSVQGAGERRNRVVHDAWSVNMLRQTTHRLQVTARKELTFGYVDLTPKELVDLVDEIAGLMDELDQLVSQIDADLTAAESGAQ